MRLLPWVVAPGNEEMILALHLQGIQQQASKVAEHSLLSCIKKEEGALQPDDSRLPPRF